MEKQYTKKKKIMEGTRGIEQQQQPYYCFVCGTVASKKCRTCHRVYCGDTCQLLDWTELGHQQQCGKPDRLTEYVGQPFLALSHAMNAADADGIKSASTQVLANGSDAVPALQDALLDMCARLQDANPAIRANSDAQSQIARIVAGLRQGFAAFSALKTRVTPLVETATPDTFNIIGEAVRGAQIVIGEQMRVYMERALITDEYRLYGIPDSILATDPMLLTTDPDALITMLVLSRRLAARLAIINEVDAAVADVEEQDEFSSSGNGPTVEEVQTPFLGVQNKVVGGHGNGQNHVESEDMALGFGNRTNYDRFLVLVFEDYWETDVVEIGALRLLEIILDFAQGKLFQFGYLLFFQTAIKTHFQRVAWPETVADSKQVPRKSVALRAFYERTIESWVIAHIDAFGSFDAEDLSASEEHAQRRLAREHFSRLLFNDPELAQNTDMAIAEALDTGLSLLRVLGAIELLGGGLFETMVRWTHPATLFGDFFPTLTDIRSALSSLLKVDVQNEVADVFRKYNNPSFRTLDTNNTGVQVTYTTFHGKVVQATLDPSMYRSLSAYREQNGPVLTTALRTLLEGDPSSPPELFRGNNWFPAEIFQAFKMLHNNVLRYRLTIPPLMPFKHTGIINWIFSSLDWKHAAFFAAAGAGATLAVYTGVPSLVLPPTEVFPDARTAVHILWSMIMGGHIVELVDFAVQSGSALIRLRKIVYEDIDEQPDDPYLYNFLLAPGLYDLPQTLVRRIQRKLMSWMSYDFPRRRRFFVDSSTREYTMAAYVLHKRVADSQVPATSLTRKPFTRVGRIALCASVALFLALKNNALLWIRNSQNDLEHNWSELPFYVKGMLYAKLIDISKETPVGTLLPGIALGYGSISSALLLAVGGVFIFKAFPMAYRFYKELRQFRSSTSSSLRKRRSGAASSSSTGSRGHHRRQSGVYPNNDDNDDVNGSSSSSSSVVVPRKSNERPGPFIEDMREKAVANVEEEGLHIFTMMMLLIIIYLGVGSIMLSSITNLFSTHLSHLPPAQLQAIIRAAHVMHAQYHGSSVARK